MTLSKEAYEKIVKKYPVLLVMDEDPLYAFNFVHDVLCAEADTLKEKCPHATRIIDGLECAAYLVWDAMNDIDTDNLGEEDEE